MPCIPHPGPGSAPEEREEERERERWRDVGCMTVGKLASISCINGKDRGG